MALRDCLIDKGWTEKEIRTIEGDSRSLTNADLLDVMTQQVGKMEDDVRRAKIQMLVIDRGMKAVNEHKSGAANGLLSMLAFDKTGKSGILSVDLMTDQYARFAYREMSDMMENLMPNWKNGWKADPVMRRNIVREIFGEASGDGDAAKFAKSYSKAVEDLRLLHNKLGGNIPKNEQWRMPQTHNAITIRKVSKDDWVNNLIDNDMLDYRSMTDRRTDLPFENAESLRPALNSMYDAITTNGASKMDWAAAQFNNIRVSGGGLSERFLKFKNGDSWLKYQEKFGEKDTYSAMVTHIQGLARETALVKQFGPNYQAGFNYLKAKASIAMGDKQRLIGRAENTMKELTGQLAGDNNKLQMWAERARAVMTFRLGSAAISAFGDQGTLALTAKINGIPLINAQLNFMKTLANGKEKQFLLQTGINADYVIDVASGLSRYDVDNHQFMSKFADRYLRASGLNAMTEAGRAGIQLSALGHLANVEKLAWKDLSTGNLRMLTESGINEADWKLMAKSKKQNIKGAKYIDIRELKPDLQMKVGNMMDVLAYRAIPAPDAEVRAILRQGTSAGTVPGELLRGGGQFKSFGVSVVLYHGAYAMALGPQTGAAYMAGMLVMTSIMGAMAVQAKQLVAGKEAMNTDDPKFWLQSFLQGGGVGIYGDFLFRDYTRYGNSFMSTLAGPSASAIETIVTGVFLANSQRAIKDLLDDNPEVFETLARGLATGTVEELKKNLPSQLWYTKLFADRFIYGSIQQMTDPDYIKKLHKREARMQRDEDRGFLFEPFEI